jgi:tRNA(fMet)-specific endonuclease VapC
MEGLRYGDVLISSITLAELHYGVAKSQRRAQNREHLEQFLARFLDIAFDEQASRSYAIVCADLESRGTPIGPLDTLIARHALALQTTVVTNNVREFGRVAGLTVDNWLD